MQPDGAGPEPVNLEDDQDFEDYKPFENDDQPKEEGKEWAKTFKSEMQKKFVSKVGEIWNSSYTCEVYFHYFPAIGLPCLEQFLS